MSEAHRRGVLLGLLSTTALGGVAWHAGATQVPWLRAETPGFIVYSSSSETRLRGIASDLESFDALLTRMTGAAAARSPVKLEVFLFVNFEAFYDAFGSHSEMILGFYTAQPELIASCAKFRNVEGFPAQTTLFHEYAHHFMFAHFANAYPAWYIEGFAEFTSTATFETNRIVLGRSTGDRVDELSRGSWIPLTRLLTMGPGDFHDGEDEEKFYSQSWLLTHYLFFTPGMTEKFQAYIVAWRQGGDPVAIFPAAFGKNVADFEADIRAYYHQGPHSLGLTRPAAVAHSEPVVTAMPNSTEDLIAFWVRVRNHVRDADKETVLATIRQRAGSSPDRFALMTLARAEAKLGDRNRARELLTPYIAANPSDAEAQFLMGLAYLEDAEAGGVGEAANLSQARHYLVAAHRLDENNVSALFRYAETFNNQPMSQDQAENTANVVLLAHSLAPQVSEISFAAAQWLMNLNRPREAVPILRAMAYDPHAGDGGRQAKEMLQQAETAAGIQPGTPAQTLPQTAPPRPLADPPPRQYQ